jgi:hypothetical protein
MVLGQLAVLINIYFWEARYVHGSFFTSCKMSPLDFRQWPPILDCGEGGGGTAQSQMSQVAFSKSFLDQSQFSVVVFRLRKRILKRATYKIFRITKYTLYLLLHVQLLIRFLQRGKLPFLCAESTDVTFLKLSYGVFS